MLCFGLKCLKAGGDKLIAVSNFTVLSKYVKIKIKKKSWFYRGTQPPWDNSSASSRAPTVRESLTVRNLGYWSVQTWGCRGGVQQRDRQDTSDEHPRKELKKMQYSVGYGCNGKIAIEKSAIKFKMFFANKKTSEFHGVLSCINLAKPAVWTSKNMFKSELNLQGKTAVKKDVHVKRTFVAIAVHKL